jgi:hypothetical protein
LFLLLFWTAVGLRALFLPTNGCANTNQPTPSQCNKHTYTTARITANLRRLDEEARALEDAAAAAAAAGAGDGAPGLSVAAAAPAKANAKAPRR